MEPMERLLECLRCRDIDFDLRGLQQAFNGKHRMELESWVSEHINPENMLTKDELYSYHALQRSGESDVFAKSLDLSTVRCVEDGEIQAAIEELEKSTASIEKQTEVLLAQQETISSFVKNNNHDFKDRMRKNEAQNKAWMTESTEVATAIEELIHSLNYEISEFESKFKATDAKLRTTASEILREDDKLLASLQKLADDLDLRISGDDEVRQRIQELCARLIKYTVEGVRTRLDCIYLESMRDSVPGTENSPLEAAESAALKEELESLYSEILPVAQMSSEQQFLNPAIHAIDVGNNQSGTRLFKAIDYVSQCLSCITERLQAFASQAEEYQSCRAVTLAFVNAAKAELEPPAPVSPIKAVKSSSPTRRKQPKYNSPIRQRNARCLAEGSIEDDTDCEQQLLNNLGISVRPGSCNGTGTSENLRDALVDRANKLHAQTQSLQDCIESAVGSHIRDMRVTWQLLNESLLSETLHNLDGGETDGTFSGLESEVEAVKSRLAGVKLGSLSEKNARKDKLIERWARRR